MNNSLPEIIINATGTVSAPVLNPHDKYNPCDFVQVTRKFCGFVISVTYGIIVDRGYGLKYLAKVTKARELVFDSLKKHINNGDIKILYRHEGLSDNEAFTKQINDFVILLQSSCVKNRKEFEEYFKKGSIYFAWRLFRTFGIKITIGGK